MSDQQQLASQQGEERRHHHHHHHHHRSDQSNSSSNKDSGAPFQGQKDLEGQPAAPVARIGKYQIVKTIGEGSFGKVKLAYHMTTGQKVALKIINRKTLAKSDMQGRIEREISYLRLLRHPHIIKLYDVIKSKDEIIMVMDFAGNELFDYIVQTGKMKETEARRFFQQIIAAVEYCHRHKIVHRDLKPENLLLDDQMNVKIADFGLSNIMTDGNFLKTSCGSPNYAAPEVISGKLYAGPEVDVWSCGVILYVMLCGRLPFDDDFIPALFKKISNGVYTLPNYLSPGAKNLLTKMLVVNPLNRITIHGIMEDEWFKTDFPDYLIPQDMRQSKHDIDMDVVKALSFTMGYDTNEIVESLKTGRTPDTTLLLDAYDLMKENKVLVDDIKKNSANMDQFLAQSPPSNWPNNKKLKTKEQIVFQALSNNPESGLGSEFQSTIAILPSSLPQIHKAYMMSKAQTQSIQEISPMSTKKSKTKWHFGIRSRSYPLDVMGEIYRALKNLGAEWVKPSEEDLWTIRVRWKYGAAKGNDEQEYMKMVIQLFQLEPNNYLVDFKFDGWEGPNEAANPHGAEDDNIDEDEMSSFSAYPFLHLSTQLILELAVNSQG